MRVVGYIRVSTLEQAHEGVSLDAQRQRIAAWCLVQGLAPELAEIHVDAGISGKRADNRPALQSALDSACRGGGTLVVYSLSRLARSVRDTLQIAERLDKSGADLVSLSERIDTTTAAGKMLFRLLAVLAEFERDLISERTRGAVALKRSRSERLGQMPYGYQLGPDGRTLVEDAEERRALELIVGLRAGGKSFRAIAAELTRQGFRPKRGRADWHHSAVHVMHRRAVPRPSTTRLSPPPHLIT